MSDKILRGLARNGNIRIMMINSKETVQALREIHDTHPTVSAALGRTVNASLMMAHMLKNANEKLIVEIRGDGPLKHILVNADQAGFVRATVSNPHLFQVKDNGKLDVSGIIGNGTLKVSREIDGKLVYTSLVELQSSEIAEDFAFYFAQSEQIPSAVSLGVLVGTDLNIESSGGLIIQVVPGATEEDIVAIEHVIEAMAPISTLMKDSDVETVFKGLFPEGEILEVNDIYVHCGCNRDQMLGVLTTLSSEDIQVLIDEDHGATLECTYCHSPYSFSEADLEGILLKRDN